MPSTGRRRRRMPRSHGRWRGGRALTGSPGSRSYPDLRSSRLQPAAAARGRRISVFGDQEVEVVQAIVDEVFLQQKIASPIDRRPGVNVRAKGEDLLFCCDS